MFSNMLETDVIRERNKELLRQAEDYRLVRQCQAGQGNKLGFAGLVRRFTDLWVLADVRRPARNSRQYS